MNTNTVTNSAQRSHGNTAGTGTNWQDAAIRIKGKWGYINRDGRIIVPCIYEEAFKVRNDVA